MISVNCSGFRVVWLYRKENFHDFQNLNLMIYLFLESTQAQQGMQTGSIWILILLIVADRDWLQLVVSLCLHNKD